MIDIKFNLDKITEILKNSKITKGLKRSACYATMATMILTSTGCSSKDKEPYTNEVTVTTDSLGQGKIVLNNGKEVYQSTINDDEELLYVYYTEGVTFQENGENLTYYIYFFEKEQETEWKDATYVGTYKIDPKKDKFFLVVGYRESFDGFTVNLVTKEEYDKTEITEDTIKIGMPDHDTAVSYGISTGSPYGLSLDIDMDRIVKPNTK